MVSSISALGHVISSAFCSLPRGWGGGAQGLAPPGISIGDGQPGVPWEDTVKIKAQIPYCYSLSLVVSALLTCQLASLPTSTLSSTCKGPCLISHVFHASSRLGYLYVLFPLSQKLPPLQLVLPGSA